MRLKQNIREQLLPKLTSAEDIAIAEAEAEVAQEEAEAENRRSSSLSSRTPGSPAAGM